MIEQVPELPSAPSGPGDFSIGPLKVMLSERRVERDGVALAIGMRAFDLLIALAGSPGEVVGRDELMARAWPNFHVEEGNLRVQIAQLRRALSNAGEDAPYISNEAGIGYSLVAPIYVRPNASAEPTHRRIANSETLPALPAGMIGREEEVRWVAEQLVSQRFVSIVGTGGIGKTMVAVAVGHSLSDQLRGAVHFVDIGPLEDEALVPGAVAASLGISLPPTGYLHVLLRAAASRPQLLIFDNCEHLIDAIAALVEQIRIDAPDLLVLVTSREPLRLPQELVYRLPPLGLPPEMDDLTANDAISFPAVQLFTSRVSEATGGYALDDASAPSVATICRRLDGVAFAIELAAARFAIYGMSGVEDLLDQSAEELPSSSGRISPRHRSLHRMLNWSYLLLSGAEQIVLRRISVFAGRFTLLEACAIGAAEPLGQHSIAGAIADLASKSLLTVDTTRRDATYRLLHTTREFGRRMLEEAKETDAAAFRHATHYADALERAVGRHDPGSRDERLSELRRSIGDVRIALEWAFSNACDVEFFVRFAAAAGALFLGMSLSSECRTWAERGLAALPKSMSGQRVELELQAALGLSLLFTTGAAGRVANALQRGADIAQALGDGEEEFRLLTALHSFNSRIGDFRETLRDAQRAYGLAKTLGNSRSVRIGGWNVGTGHHMVGHHAEAIAWCASALQDGEDWKPDVSDYAIDHRVRALCAVSRSLWMAGRVEDAEHAARLTIQTARRSGHPVSLDIATAWIAPVHVWSGELDQAEEMVSELASETGKRPHGICEVIAHGIRGQILTRRGRFADAEKLLRASLTTLNEDEHRSMIPSFQTDLAKCVGMDNRRKTEAMSIIEQAIAEIERSGDISQLPELLCARSEILFRGSDVDEGVWEEDLHRAVLSARAQGALSLELKANLVRTKLRSARDLPTDYDALAAVAGRFSQGRNSLDLRMAKLLLDKGRMPK